VSRSRDVVNGRPATAARQQHLSECSRNWVEEPCADGFILLDDNERTAQCVDCEYIAGQVDLKVAEL
jgi:hypothetical protein